MRRGIAVICATCGNVKKPHGRSAPLDHQFCDSQCAGYNESPRPGCLWPRETAEDFGYPVCDHATEELIDLDGGDTDTLDSFMRRS